MDSREKDMLRRKIGLMKDVTIRKRFDKKVIELFDIGAPNLRGHIKDGVLKVCNEVCRKKGREANEILGGGTIR